MAPGRRKGARGGGGGAAGGGGGGVGAKPRTEFSLGDLVLAKVKGFPAWPAKISRPEDWKRAPDPKKYFVQFFGTEEIAFVAPVDIEAFTTEAKNRLSARCRGKTVKYFAQAVKEICEDFEQLQQKNSSGLRDDHNKLELGNAAPPSADGIDDAGEPDLKEPIDNDGPNQSDRGSGLERCFQRQGETEGQQIKRCVSEDINGKLSPTRPLKKVNKLSKDGAKLVKEEAVLASTPRSQSFKKESSRDRKVEDYCSRQMSHIGGSNDSEISHSPAVEEDCSLLRPSDHADYPNDVQKDLIDGQRSRLATGSKWKHESSYEIRNISDPAVPTSNQLNSSNSKVDLSLSNRQYGNDARKKIVSGGKELSHNVLKTVLDTDSGKRTKMLLKEKKNFEATYKPRLAVEENFEEDKIEISLKKPGHGKQTPESNEFSHPAKRSKHQDMTDGAPKLLIQTSRKVDSQSQDDKMDNVEVKRSVLRGKAENRFSNRALSTNSDPNPVGDEDVLPPTKRRRRALEAMSSPSTLKSENQIGRKTVAPKLDTSRRRAVRLCDDDEEEEPKTPIHGGSAKKVLAPSCAQASTKRADLHSSFHGQLVKRESGKLDDSSLRKLAPACEHPVVVWSPNSQLAEEKKHGKAAASRVSFSPGEVDSEKGSFKDGNPVPTLVLVSPKRSPLSIVATKLVAETQKANKNFGKVFGNISQRKAVSGPKVTGTISDSVNSSVNQQPTESEGNKFTQPTEREGNKFTPKSYSKANDPAPLAGNLMETHSVPEERSEAGRGEKRSPAIAQKMSDPVMSMRNLIAAAQAKRRQAHLQNLSINPNSLVVSDTDLQVSSSSPAPDGQSLASSNIPSLDVHGFLLHSSAISPSTAHQVSTINQHDSDEFEERRVSSGRQAAGGSLSGGTEAAVARDAFEGMIETLSRTKESIGRATRLAIDCAKYGIANEVVELLIRKLENESSFHRKVDLFFLVDSITQCSNNHKGIAGASYIPAVQAALPRLLGAAAPPGPAARENRRQCLKVLRLWLERKILPESLLRRYLDDIGVVNDDTSSGFSLRRPSRAERAIDDPIREMEGMLVDEYGSNATFQLPGIFSSNMFQEEDEEEEDFPNVSSKGGVHISPSEHTPASGYSENHTVTPNERRHHILEDVDGELEMEDVSGHLKDERPSLTSDAFGIAPCHFGSVQILESAANISFELPPLPDGSPPLPRDSPPVTPPLPSSPPPSPPPPPPSLPPLPPPPPSPSPPPPPPPPLQPYPLPPPPAVPPMLPPLPSLPPQPPMVSQHMHPLPPSNLSSSVLAYQPPPLSHEIGGNPSENTLPPMAGNGALGPPIDASARNEGFPPQAPGFAPVGVGSSREPYAYNSSRPVEYGHNDLYVNPQASQPTQHFQPGNMPFAHRPLPPNPPPQNIPNHFSYPTAAIQQQPLPPAQHHPPQPYRPPYSLPNFADGPRQFVPDERWRMGPNELNAEHQRGMWMPGVRSCSGPAYVQDGYFRPPLERPPPGTAGFRPSVANTLPGGNSVPGHGVNHMIPSRPDMSSLGWRPT